MNIVNILLVEDEAVTSAAITRFLNSHHHHVVIASSINEAITKINNFKFDVAIIDRQLPDGDGLKIINYLKKTKEIHTTGVIMTSCLSSTSDIIECLKNGADDYLPKPVNTEELLFRIYAILRRIKPKTNIKKTAALHNLENKKNFRVFHQFTLCSETRFLTKENSCDVVLTEGEFNMLTMLINNQGTPVSRAQLLQINSNREITADSRTIDVVIGRLRKKLYDSSSDPKLLITVRGKGYMMPYETQ